MKTCLVVFYSCYVLAFRIAAAEESKERLLLFRCGDNAELLFEIPTTKAEALPKWTPENGKPAPLSISRACTLAKEALKARTPALDDFEVYAITMRHIEWNRMYETRRTDTWFYEIECRAKRDGKYTAPCGLIAIILMNGTNVEPTITRKEKEAASQ